MANARLTVLQLLPSLHGGGVEQGTLELARGLVEAGHHPLVVSAGGPMVAELEALGGEHLQLAIGEKSPRVLSRIPYLRQLMLERAVDIVHMRSRLPAWIGYAAYKTIPSNKRPRLVTTVHGFYRVNRYSRIMTRGERVICVSNAIHDYVRRSFPSIDPSRMRIIHRGVDRNYFTFGYRPSATWLEHWQRHHATTKPSYTLLLPGRITRLKGHAVFLRLIRRLRDDGVPARGLIVGGQDPRRERYAAQLTTLLRELALETAVELLGHRNDLRDIMAVSDLVFSLSVQPESFGRTTLEALSLGRPVIGFAHGGVDEILQAIYPHGAVPASDEFELYRVTRTLLEQPQPVPAEHSFTRQKMIDQTLAVYRELVTD